MSDASSFPTPPRPLTRAARRRSWGEPAVRGWLLGALVLMALAVHSVWSAVSTNADQQWLLMHGRPVEATIYASGRGRVPGIAYPPDGFFTLLYDRQSQDGRIQPERVETSFPEQRDSVISGSKITLYVDPIDPAHWTSKSASLHWWSGLTSGILMLFFALLLIGVAALLRRQRLRWFEVGTVVDAIVVAIRTTPLAPLSQAVRCSDPNSGAPGATTVYLPRSAGIVRVGETIPLICVPNRPERALAAGPYFQQGESTV